MRCSNCGKEYKAGDKFCFQCGSPLQQLEGQTVQQTNVVEARAPFITVSNSADNAAKNTGNARPGKNKKALKVILPIFLAVILAIICLNYFGIISLKSIGIFSSSDTITAFESDVSLAVSGGGNPKISLNMDNLRQLQYSLNGSKAAGLINYTDNDGGELWYLTAQGKTKISDGVTDYVIADNGGGVAYFKDYDTAGQTASLYLYNAGSKKDTKVADEVYALGPVCISPDGKSVSYIKDFDTENREFSGYVKIGGKTPEKIGTNSISIAISNKGKYIYYLKVDMDNGTSSLYARQGKNETKLVSSETTSDNANYLLNKDYSQIIFTYNNRSYISKNGKDKEKLVSNIISSLVIPNDVNLKYNNKGNLNIYCITYGVEDFSSFTALTEENSLIYVNNNDESNVLDKNITLSAVDKAGTEAYFIDSTNDLYKMKLNDENAEKTRIAEQVTNFKITPDGSRIYYVNTDNELNFIKGSSEPKKIADDVEPYSLSLTSDGGTAFFLVDYISESGELYYSKNGGKKAKIVDDVYRVITTLSGTYYYTNFESSDSTFDVYRRTGGTKFEPFQNGVKTMR